MEDFFTKVLTLFPKNVTNFSNSLYVAMGMFVRDVSSRPDFLIQPIQADASRFKSLDPQKPSSSRFL